MLTPCEPSSHSVLTTYRWTPHAWGLGSSPHSRTSPSTSLLLGRNGHQANLFNAIRTIREGRTGQVTVDVSVAKICLRTPLCNSHTAINCDAMDWRSAIPLDVWVVILINFEITKEFYWVVTEHAELYRTQLDSFLRAQDGVAVFMSAHRKTLYITPGMDFPLGKR